MDLTALFFSLALLVLVGIYLYAPLAKRNALPITEEEHELSALMAERDRILNALQELDFDFKLGKIPIEDYPVQRTELLQKGADILRKLDEITLPSPQALSPIGNGERVEGLDLETRIERAVAARRADRIPTGSTRFTEPALANEDVELMISARRKAHQKKSAGFCPKCGKPVMQSDRFCPSCGKALT
jgi:hypothetical protein